jgi:hypothetical protein
LEEEETGSWEEEELTVEEKKEKSGEAGTSRWS